MKCFLTLFEGTSDHLPQHNRGDFSQALLHTSVNQICMCGDSAVCFNKYYESSHDGKEKVNRWREGNVQMVELSWFLLTRCQKCLKISSASESFRVFWHFSAEKWRKIPQLMAFRSFLKVHETTCRFSNRLWKITAKRERSKVHQWFQCQTLL